MRFLQILGFTLLISTTLVAQEPLSARGDNYFFLGLSLPIAKVRDQAHSPQTYQGLTTTFTLGYDRIGRDAVSRLAFLTQCRPRDCRQKRVRSPNANCQVLMLTRFKSRWACSNESGITKQRGGIVMLAARCRSLLTRESTTCRATIYLAIKLIRRSMRVLLFKKRWITIGDSIMKPPCRSFPTPCDRTTLGWHL
jgi:hypothetical protein